MSSAPNQFVWYELLTHDPQAATTFYGQVFGWSAKPHPGSPPEHPYLILSVGDRGVGGVMDIAASDCGEDQKPHWLGYIAVDDVDATVARITEAGGAVHKPPADIPGVGRFAGVADPSGAAFMLITPMGEGQPPADPYAPGLPGWRELYADDGKAALAFYGALFGWTEDRAMDMGPMGVYHIFAAGGPAIGGMMSKPPNHPVAHWSYYFNVESVDAGIERVNAGGGKVVNGPQEVPGPMWIAQCQDPQGGMFAMVGAK